MLHCTHGMLCYCLIWLKSSYYSQYALYVYIIDIIIVLLPSVCCMCYMGEGCLEPIKEMNQVRQESIRGSDGKSWGLGSPSDPDGQEGRTSPVGTQVDLGEEHNVPQRVYTF